MTQAPMAVKARRTITSYCCRVLLALFLLSATSPVFMDAANAVNVGDCWDTRLQAYTTCTSYTPSSGSSGGSTYSGPSWAEIRQQQRQQQASAINDQGNVYYSNKDYATSIKYYERALRINPNDSVIANNLRKARGSLINQEGIALANEGKYREALEKYKAAYRIKPESKGIRKNLEHAQGVVNSWDKTEQYQKQRTLNAATFSRNISELSNNLEPKKSTATFGDKTGGLSLMGPKVDLSKPAAIKTGATKTAAEQARSAGVHGESALNAKSAEGMKREASMVFDTPGTYQGTIEPPELKGVPVAERSDPFIAVSHRTPEITRLVEKRTEIRAKRKELEKDLQTLKENPRQDTVRIAKIKQEITNIENEEHFLNFSIKETLKPLTADKAAAAPSKKTEPPSRGLTLIPLGTEKQ